MLKPTDEKAKAIPAVRKYLVAEINWRGTYRAFFNMPTAPKGMSRPSAEKLEERREKFLAAKEAAVEELGSLEALERYIGLVDVGEAW